MQIAHASQLRALSYSCVKSTAGREPYYTGPAILTELYVFDKEIHSYDCPACENADTIGRVDHQELRLIVKNQYILLTLMLQSNLAVEDKMSYNTY